MASGMPAISATALGPGVGGPHRVRGLQRMATLHAAPALCALPDGHMKAPDDRPDDGEIFVLRRHGAVPPPRRTPDTPQGAGP